MIKLKSKQVIEKEIEITLPYFFKTATGSHHAILDDKTIRIWSDSICFLDFPAASLLGEEGNIEITSEDFMRAFDAKINQIQELKSLFFQPK